MQHISCWRQSGSLPSFPCPLTVGLRVFVNLATLKQMWSGNNYSAAVKPSSFVLDTFSCCHFSWPSWVCLVSFDTADGQLNPSSWWRKACAGVLEVLPMVILLGPQVELLWDLGAGATFLRRGVIDYTVTSAMQVALSRKLSFFFLSCSMVNHSLVWHQCTPWDFCASTHHLAAVNCFPDLPSPDTYFVDFELPENSVKKYHYYHHQDL